MKQLGVWSIAACCIFTATFAFGAISIPEATSTSTETSADEPDPTPSRRPLTPAASAQPANPGPRAEQVPTAGQPTGNPLWAIPLRQLSATRDRPVFSPSRRPPPPAVVAPIAAPAVRPVPKPAEPERPRISLVGTIASKIEGIGVFIDQETKKTIRLKIGEAHNGWALSTIKAREVTLRKERATAVLGLPPPGGKEAGALRLVTETQASSHPLASSNPFAAAVSGQDPFEARRRQLPPNPFQSASSGRNPFATPVRQEINPAPGTRPANPFAGPPPQLQLPSGVRPSHGAAVPR